MLPQESGTLPLSLLSVHWQEAGSEVEAVLWPGVSAVLATLSHSISAPPDSTSPSVQAGSSPAAGFATFCLSVHC